MAKKQNNLFLIGAIGLVAYILLKKPAVPEIIVEPTPPPVTPLEGDLTIPEKRQALQNYANANGKNWGDAPFKMTEVDVVTVYHFVFNCLLARGAGTKCIPTSSDWARMKNIGYKYGITI